MQHPGTTSTARPPRSRRGRRRVLAPAALTAAAALTTLVVRFAVPGPARAAPGDVTWSDFHQRVAGGDAYTILAVTPAGGRSAFMPGAARAVTDKAVFAVGPADGGGGDTATFIARFRP